MNSTAGVSSACIPGGIPVSLFVVMTSLAGVGCLYSVALIAFNVVYRTHKLIKMTSPNINIVILCGTILAFTSVVLLGLDTTFLTQLDTSYTVQSCTYLLIFSFTLIYGSLFAKVCRVFMIFSNLSFNGKSSRDEHLLLAVAILLLLDLTILLPWQLVDPVTCSQWNISSSQTLIITSNTTTSDVTCETVISCGSNRQVMWISVVYCYKAVLLAVGLYFTWNTRQVTLAALRDSGNIAAAVSLVTVVSLIALPCLLVHSTDSSHVTSTTTVLRYAVGSLCICFGLTATTTCLFVPKVMLLVEDLKKCAGAEAGAVNSDTQLQFSESLRKTRESVSRGCCASRMLCCTGLGHGDDINKYAVELLATEIETLQLTVKEKEATIRELTDRLYVGAEQFQRYLTSTQRHQAAVQSRPDIYRMTSRPAPPTSTIYPAPVAMTTNYAVYDDVSCESCTDDVTSSGSEDDDDDVIVTSSRQTEVVCARPRQLCVSDLMKGADTYSNAEHNRHRQTQITKHSNTGHVRPRMQVSVTSAERRMTSSPGHDDSAFDSRSPDSSTGESTGRTVAVVHRQPGRSSVHSPQRIDIAAMETDAVTSLSRDNNQRALRASTYSRHSRESRVRAVYQI